MTVYHEDPPPTNVSRAIDALNGKRVQCCAAAIEMCLTQFDEKRHHLIMEPTRLTIAQIAVVAGYSHAAVWHALPVIAQGGLLRWRKLDDESIEVTWLIAWYESEVAA